MSSAWIWQRAYWDEKKRVRAMRRAGQLPPRARVRRRLEAEAARRRDSRAPRMTAVPVRDYRPRPCRPISR